MILGLPTAQCPYCFKEERGYSAKKIVRVTEKPFVCPVCTTPTRSVVESVRLFIRR